MIARASSVRGRVTTWIFATLVVACAAVAALDAPPRAAAGATVKCDLVASPEGADTGAGTEADPLRTAERLVDELRPGQTGCLRSGVYAAGPELQLTQPRITLRSYPGERAELRTRLWITKEADGAVVSGLRLDGRNPARLPSPTVNASNVTLRGNDITNHRTSTCISLGSDRKFGRAERAVIEGNLVHDCGVRPATNKEHGIYVSSSDDAIIRNNWIYANADRGIQLYPDSQGTTISGNVISDNGQGVIFGGDASTASSENLVAGNVIIDSRVRGNVEASWVGPIGTGNEAVGNCIGGGAYDDGDLGIESNAGYRWEGNTRCFSVRRICEAVDEMLGLALRAA